MKVYQLSICILLFLCIGLDGEESSKFKLDIRVTGAKPSQGPIHVVLFTNPSNYLKKPVKTLTKQVDPNGDASFLLELEKGHYSICAFHDKNGNGKLDRGLLGIPRERIAFSNQAKGKFGPPDFKDTLIDLKTSTSLKLALKKPKK